MARGKRTPRRITATSPCPCGLGEAYAHCCGELHAGRSSAPTAEALMRSRYSAFAAGDTGYLLRTWHPRTRPAELELDPAQHWTGLRITGHTAGGMLHTEGTVTFEAHYERRGVPGVQSEDSTFSKVDGQWLYVAGTAA